MSDLLTAISLVLLPTWLACGVAIKWGQLSASNRLGRILGVSGAIWLPVLTICFIILIVPPYLCDGNVFYGYTDCRTISARLITTLSGVSFVLYAIGMLYGALLLVVGGIWESVARNVED